MTDEREQAPPNNEYIHESCGCRNCEYYVPEYQVPCNHPLCGDGWQIPIDDCAYSRRRRDD